MPSRNLPCITKWLDANGEVWRSQRKVAANIFNVKLNFRDIFTLVFVEESKKLVQAMDTAHKLGAAIELQDLLLRATMDSFVRIAMGKNPDALDKKGSVNTNGVYEMEVDKFMEAYDSTNEICLVRAFKPFWQITDHFDGTAKKQKQKHNTNVMHAFARSVITQRQDAIANGHKGNNLLDLFLEAANIDGTRLTERQMIDVALNFIMPGRDTTAQTLTWVFLRLIYANARDKQTDYESSRAIEPIYTNSRAVIVQSKDADSNDKLATSVAEDVMITDLDTGKLLLKLQGDADQITCLAARPNGLHIVTAARSLLLKLWNVSSGELVRSWKAHEAPVLTMDFDPTSTLCATGSADSTIKVWDVEKGFATHNLKGHKGVIAAVKFHPDKRRIRLVSGSDDGQIRLWDLSSRKCIAVLNTHVSVIRSLDFTPDGRYMLAAARDKIMTVWDMSATPLHQIQTIPVYESIEAAGFLASGTPLPSGAHVGANQLVAYSAGEKGIIQLWDVQQNECIYSQTATRGAKHSITDVIAYSPSLHRHDSDSNSLPAPQHQLVAVTSDYNLLFYSLPNLDTQSRQIAGYNDEVIDLAFAGPEHNHLVVATNSEQLRVYDLSDGSVDVVYGGHEDVVICLDMFGPDVLVTGGKDGVGMMWKLNLGDRTVPLTERYRCVGRMAGHTEAISAIALSRRQLKFAVTGSQDRTVKAWNLASLSPTTPAPAPERLKTLYTFKAHDKDINSIAVSPNDKTFATASQDKTIKIWSADSGTHLGTCTGHKRGVWCVAYSPTDATLASSSGDKTVRIWSLGDYSCLKTFEGHLNSVLRVHYITAGTQLATSGSDGLVKVWNVKSNDCATTLDGHEDKAWALAVRRRAGAHDDDALASGGADSKIVVWTDMTRAVDAVKAQQEADRVDKEQDLQNSLQRRDYAAAIRLALHLGQPVRLLDLFGRVLDERACPAALSGSRAVDTFILGLDDSDLVKLLGFIRDWNTTNRGARVAQTVLHVVVRCMGVERLLELPKIKEILESLIPYTERHYKNIDVLLTSSYILEYTLASMDGLAPLDAGMPAVAGAAVAGE
ncbi:hypothetical protein SeLEV6574_g03999 [Synchytrium endobioticum]|uniref:U3 small nucleolar RNA-associated protein 13 C-terminal domain-containing protein n=1 Tax=Synchytrium endobioticum TaxID=286115 RepID=A0A507D1C3_9FUNG|nr:hypothetical protein SeLEV6574_g03999 [Synchytrium endobioticum]